jgi:integrase
LDGEDILEYLQFRVYTIRGDHHKLRNPTPIVQLLDDLWELRHDYVASLQVNPAQLHHEIARIVPAHSCRRWKALDESIALPLIRDAITWKNTHGEFVLYALQSIYETASKMGGVKLNDRRKRLRALYASLDDKPDMAVLRTALNLPHQKVFIVLRKALAQTEGACLIILLFLIGFRSQELLSLNVDTLRMDTLEDGEKIYRLSGVSAKKGGIGRTWVASPPIVDVIDYLTRLNAPIRRATGQKALFLSRIGPGYRRAGFGKRLTNGSITKRMREFANAPHRQGKPAVMRLHPHAARKTFARFVVLRDKSALEALSYHFGHTHRMITDGYYVGSDIELARMISEEGRRDLANSMLEIMRSGAIAGRAGRALQALRSDETMSVN